MTLPSYLGRGERAPDFILSVQDGTPTRFYAIAGGLPTLLVFTPAIQTPLLNFIQALTSQTEIAPFVIQYPSDTPEVPFPVFIDTDGKIHAVYRIKEETETILFVLNANLQVLASGPLDDPDRVVHSICRTLQTQSATCVAQEITTQAPVLLIPNVLDMGICRVLIDTWKTQGHEQTGVEQSTSGQRKAVLDNTLKKRSDHTVTDAKLMRLLTTTVGRRVIPELRKAFQFNATRFEGFKIVCYNAADSGFFHAHRDNLSPNTAHRRFAMSLNLNDGYQGGHLRFAEYGPHLYKPVAGGAVVFSCTHLHEVTPVTSGQRFALLSFLFGENDIRQTQPT